ncbi:beta-amylase 1 chloroplastic [Phtheirospermum japonicum]|uniref:Beta-amylase n=1 Tax=Phtheirospermum japonicum TaxID=374723 RepID=A0A830BWJ1_9LAMI|nr:beta-amylase 1 chloroplastic [Phtheirospermum japonicum]
MAIASPSAPSFCCTTRSGTTHRRFAQSISKRAGSNRHVSGHGPTQRLFRWGVGVRAQLQQPPPREGAFPVYVTLPSDAVGPTAQTMRRKRAMAQSFRALAAAGVEGLVMEVWWGLVEREFPRRYNWQGYLEIVEMARRFGLKVRASMAFHQCGLGPNDPFWIPLPVWVLEEMDKDPNVSYADRFGRTNMEYVSLGCDILPILHGRSPIQAYADLMRNFRDTFRSFLGGVITGIQVGLGPGGELRYPSSPTQKLTWARRSRELSEFQCYDKYMLASLYASTRELSLVQNPDSTDFFLRWYSKTLLLHGERICREAETIFRGNKVNMSGKVAGAHWHYDTAIKDGFVPIVRMFGRYGFTVCCTCFEMRDDEMNRAGRPESLLKQLVLAARICDVPLEGENSSTDLDDESFGQILKMSKLYSDGLETPSFSFNFVRMDKNLFEPRNWVSFTRFVRRVSEMNVFRAGLDFEGGNGSSSPPVAAFAGAVLAY